MKSPPFSAQKGPSHFPNSISPLLPRANIATASVLGETPLLREIPHERQENLEAITVKHGSLASFGFAYPHLWCRLWPFQPT
jgi:hypothetical protein